MSPSDTTRRYIMWLALLLVIVALAFVMTFFSRTSPQVVSGPAVPAQSIPTPQDQVTAQTGFQYLVSYTDKGFSPSELSITEGQTVRFTNNSGGELWVAASGSRLYPAVQNGCGSSALDSCKPLAPGQYWQFTFSTSGTWSFQNNLDKTKAGTVTVK